jgi:hypothetical protein
MFKEPKNMKVKLFLISLIASQALTAQIDGNYTIFAKEFSKELSLYKAKKFVLEQVFLHTDKPSQFEIDPLAATISGEVTSLYYKCEEQNKEGLVIGFYGDYWNEAGVLYQGYGFKNLQKESALKILDKISETINLQTSYLLKDPDNNNIYFSYDDLLFLIYVRDAFPSIRIFWNNFDAEWQMSAFKRTKKRFEKNLK